MKVRKFVQVTLVTLFIGTLMLLTNLVVSGQEMADNVCQEKCKKCPGASSCFNTGEGEAHNTICVDMCMNNKCDIIELSECNDFENCLCDM